MPFGFGFNKAKVLASAEKNVKAGKLQHAIADYEKIVKEDAKDLTVLNTIGDLYARLGKTEQATSYYKRVADAFASSGFTVKAIAMYKKITKLDSSSIDSLNRLAELFAQQGLHSDARAQYGLVAEHHLKNGALDKAANVFQKVLDLDPENATMQAKLAELYVRLGKKNEARDIYLRNAELYRSRKNFAAADESLGQVLSIDKTFSQALLLRGLVKMELGDASGTVQCLEQVPDLDSRPEGLRSLLAAQLKLGKLEAAGPIARKLYTVFQESQGLVTYGEALVAADRAADALAVYSEFADVLLSSQSDTVVAALQGCISRVKDTPAALEQLSGLLERAGQTIHLAEIKELLAHASVQCGDLAKARDLYRELARIEPDNPLHTQNYRQVLAKLGEDSSARALTAEEAAQPMLVDELEGTLPELPREYDPAVTEIVRAALTEAELFDSYNLPSKAIGPLEAVLTRAPQDPQVNQRLASLYARTSRFDAAAARCQALELVYKQAGYPEQAHEYGELAAKYAARAGITLPAQPTLPAPATRVESQQKPEAVATPAAFGLEEFSQPAAEPGSVAEFEFVPAAPEPEFEPQVAAAGQEFQASAPAFESAATADRVVGQTPAVFEAAVAEGSGEFDLSEWEELVEVEVEPTAQADTTEVVVAPDPLLETTPTAHLEPTTLDASPEARVEAVVEAAEPAPITDVQHVAEPAASDLAPMAQAAPTTHVTAFEAPPLQADTAIFEMLGAEPEAGYPERVTDLVEEIRFYASQAMWDEAQGALAALEHEAPEAANRLRAELNTLVPAEAVEVTEVDGANTAALDEIEVECVSEVETVEATEIVATPVASIEPEPAVAEIAAAPVEAPVEAPVAETEPLELAASAHADSFDNLLDLDSALGEDFEIAPTAVAAEVSVAPAPLAAAITPQIPSHADTIPAVQTMSAAAGSPLSYPTPPAVTTAETTSSAPPASIAVTAPAATGATDVSADDAFDFSGGALADIFAEFKNDMEAGSEEAEDPETHYNLGVAFKEMGLLDEAIGELQKVCQAIDRGHTFSQVLQAYTWLADCFVHKGVPEAAVRWYEKALRSPLAQGETATAIHYELACACEQAGNRATALTHFMEVYGSNIDYRDVADRIKALRS